MNSHTVVTVAVLVIVFAFVTVLLVLGYGIESAVTAATAVGIVALDLIRRILRLTRKPQRSKVR